MRYSTPAIIDHGSIARHTFGVGNTEPDGNGCYPFPGGAGQDGTPKGTAPIDDKFCYPSHGSPA